MAAEKPFVESVQFLYNLGIYDVVLPFLMIFTLTYAVLDKTKVLGTEEFEGKQYPKKNVNAMLAFVIAFFTVLSSKVVQWITQLTQWIVLILVAFFLFMLLLSSFESKPATDKDFILNKKWKIGLTILSFSVVAFIVIMLIIYSFSDARAVAQAAGSWFTQDNITFLIIIGLIILAIVAVLRSGGSPSHKKSS